MIGDDALDFNGPHSQIALTCLPRYADDAGALEAESEGCRTDTLNQLRTCICWGADYCNDSQKAPNNSFMLFCITVGGGLVYHLGMV